MSLEYVQEQQKTFKNTQKYVHLLTLICINFLIILYIQELILVSELYWLLRCIALYKQSLS